MYRFALLIAAAVLFAPAATSTVRADAPTAAEKKLLAEAAARLLAICPTPPEGMEWPPDIALDEKDDINAYATIVRKDGKIYPIIRIHHGMMTKIIKGDADRLAFILGHELGHLLKGHVISKTARDNTAFKAVLFTRVEEDEADQVGAELLLKAGYSFAKALKAITAMQDMGLEYSSFEGLSKDHPSWNDRLAKMDKDKSHLWKAMSAFENGVVFLATEKFEEAEICFEKVTKEFPSCYEAWANLGYARLMRYCDKLDPKELAQYDIGQIVTGGFYHRGPLLRTKDVKLWWAAVGALNESNRLKAEQTLVLANLGLAYLLHPDGKDVGESTRYFAEASKAAETDKDLDPIAHAAILINFGVATLAAGKPEQGLAKLDEGEKAVRALASGRTKRLVPALDAALLYSRAITLAAKPANREQALALFEKYLSMSSRLSLWWDAAYHKYTTLAADLGKMAKPKDAFGTTTAPKLRITVGVKLKSGKTITLGDLIEDVEAKLGKGISTSLMPGTDLARIRYEALGIEILGGNEEVLAVFLIGPNAPPLPVRGTGPVSAEAGTISIGMTTAELQQLLGDEYQPCEIAATEVYYRFYRDKGLAVRVSKGKVVEVVVVQLPEPR